MINTHSFKKALNKIHRHHENRQYDIALREVDELLKSWPGNAHLYVLRGRLIQLQDDTTHSLDEAKQSLERAVDLDTSSPVGAIELGYYLDAIEDNPRAATSPFAEGIVRARRLLMEGLVGQARALLQLDKKDEALKCIMESLYLANVDHGSPNGKSPNGAPDILWRDPAGQLLALQVKGPFALMVEDLLQELFLPRPAMPTANHV